MSKKIILPILVLLLSLTSCTETIVERYSADNWQIVDIDIPYNSWNAYTDQNGSLFYAADIYVPEITSFVYTDGFVLCYCMDGDTQMPLPYVRHNCDNQGNIWTTTLDYEYNIGVLHVYYTNNDFNYMDGEPNATRLRLVLQW